jgi:glycine/D-amino acid oxidase-like deaminating enzyme
MNPDAVVIGGGFYGASVAVYLRERRGLKNVVLLERDDRLMQRSSYNNQARIHSGYHYLRSFTTAYRSRVNFPRFIAEFPQAVYDGFQQVYALARRNSKVTNQQMRRFCAEIGAPLLPAPKEYASLFDPRLIEAVYLTEETAFNADALREILVARLKKNDVAIRLGAEVNSVRCTADGVVVEGQGFSYSVPMIFNCTYSRLQQTVSGVGPSKFSLKPEIAEMALVDPPPQLKNIGITVMDGAFFSCMPFPARGLHSLSHVRYTPHRSWQEDGARDPYEILANDDKESRADRMILDAARYVPLLRNCVPMDTLFEIKTVLLQNEADDGRPILFERHAPHGRVFSILGGKIDNIYDILERLDAEKLPEQVKS